MDDMFEEDSRNAVEGEEKQSISEKMNDGEGMDYKI